MVVKKQGGTDEDKTVDERKQKGELYEDIRCAKQMVDKKEGG